MQAKCQSRRAGVSLIFGIIFSSLSLDFPIKFEILLKHNFCCFFFFWTTENFHFEFYQAKIKSKRKKKKNVQQKKIQIQTTHTCCFLFDKYTVVYSFLLRSFTLHSTSSIQFKSQRLFSPIFSFCQRMVWSWSLLLLLFSRKWNHCGKCFKLDTVYSLPGKVFLDLVSNQWTITFFQFLWKEEKKDKIGEKWKPKCR